jgi:hypothetical protein
MSYFTGWFESVVQISAKLDFAIEDYKRLQRIIIAGLELAEFKTGNKHRSESVKEMFDALDKELFLAQLGVKNDITGAFNKHYERNRDKELNRQGDKQ